MSPSTALLGGTNEGGEDFSDPLRKPEDPVLPSRGNEEGDPPILTSSPEIDGAFAEDADKSSSLAAQVRAAHSAALRLLALESVQVYGYQVLGTSQSQSSIENCPNLVTFSFCCSVGPAAPPERWGHPISRSSPSESTLKRLTFTLLLSASLPFDRLPQPERKQRQGRGVREARGDPD